MYCIVIVQGNDLPIPCVYGPFEDMEAFVAFTREVHDAQGSDVEVTTMGPVKPQAVNQESMDFLIPVLQGRQ